MSNGVLIPVLKRTMVVMKEIVLPPKTGLYLDELLRDYSSLYPSSMIMKIFTHDSKV